MLLKYVNDQDINWNIPDCTSPSIIVNSELQIKLITIKHRSFYRINSEKLLVSSRIANNLCSSICFLINELSDAAILLNTSKENCFTLWLPFIIE